MMPWPKEVRHLTGMSILQQAYSLMEQPERMTADDSGEEGLLVVNQIYSELWHREHRTMFVPLGHLKQRLELSWRFMPAMAYGAAMLLSLGQEAAYDRYLELYRRAAAHAGGLAPCRMDTLFRGVAE